MADGQPLTGRMGVSPLIRAAAPPPRYRHSGEGRNPAAPKAICSRAGAPAKVALARAAEVRICGSAALALPGMTIAGGGEIRSPPIPDRQPKGRSCSPSQALAPAQAVNPF